MLTTHEGAIQGATLPTLNFLWLEITGRCNLQCSHCYAESAPQGTHGAMHTGDWERILTEAHGLGCRSIQFIGGEPTLHPALPQLMRLTAEMDMQVEIYTNLVRIKPALWDVFQECQVRIATSFYSLHPDVHETITQGSGSFRRTVANINQALQLGLPLRVGLIEMRPDQDIAATECFLRDLGVQRIGVDQVRSVGRGRSFLQVERPEETLCGACARGKAAIVPSGEVYPCVFSRWLPVGNVLHHPLGTILAAEPMKRTRQQLARHFQQRDCNPNVCSPDDCAPFCEPYDCSPDIPSGCNPTKPLCLPDYMPCNPEKFPPCSPDTCNPDACRPNQLPE
jgi:MoaA/NifB/PqqE/SkfB family radical SAM enzyme